MAFSSDLWYGIRRDASVQARIERAWVALLQRHLPGYGPGDVSTRFLTPWRTLVHTVSDLAVDRTLRIAHDDLPAWLLLMTAVTGVLTEDGAAGRVLADLCAALTQAFLDDHQISGSELLRPRLRVVEQEPAAPSTAVPERWLDRLGLVGASAVMEALYLRCLAVARDPYPVLISGETGSGKEVVARAIHEASGARGRFVGINCAALPETLVEAELFGHARGAFTGASSSRPGLIAEASGGTLLLDEMTEISTATQAKLLRTLQQGTYRAVGSTRLVEASVRVIATTNRDLVEALAAGALRRDLYYRLCVHRITVAPLREHAEDIPELVAAFLARWSSAAPDLAPPRFTAEAMAVLGGERWPGNARQLEHLVYRLASERPGEDLDAPDVLEVVRDDDASSGRGDGDPALATLDELEGDAVSRSLQATRGNKAAAARLLGISRKTLYHKLRTHGLEADGPPRKPGR